MQKGGKLKDEDLHKAITISDEVRSLIETSTWQNYIEPLFDALIIDVLGGKIADRWVNGALDNKMLSESSLRELQQYKAGIVALHQAIYSLVDEGELVKRELASRAKLMMESDFNNQYSDGVSYEDA